MKHINLETFASGAFTKQVNRALEDVTKNIQDPNTDATAVRKVTITISLKPNEQRNFVATGVVSKATLAPELGAVTALSMGKDIKTGNVEAVEIGNQIPGQLALEDMEEAETTEVLKKVVDPSTGEIYETPVNAVVNLREVRQSREA